MSEFSPADPSAPPVPSSQPEPLPTPPGSANRPPRFAWPALLAIVLGAGLPFSVLMIAGGKKPVAAGSTAQPEEKQKPVIEEKISPHDFQPPPQKEQKDEKERKKVAAPELEGGVAWLNSGGPLSIKKDLKGKIVLLDFWTLCCINCIHIMPDLAKLEKKYAKELVVIGVHSPKFENEKETNSIRKAILRYQIEHPVINDANHRIWNQYGIDAWPTLVLIDPEGNMVGYTSGEGNYEVLDEYIGKLAADFKKKQLLNEKPLRFDLARYRESGDTPLFFPGKVLADEKGKRLFIADSTHHRIVVTDLDGKQISVAGTGVPGTADGAFDKAEFHDPQGMAVRDDTLYVADRKNHTIRELDLKARTVRTIAGTGEQDPSGENRRLDRPVPARSIGLNSPWDLLLDGDSLYIAMAGHHQIWRYDLKKKDLAPYAGNGREDIRDGAFTQSSFAQPSGLATDGKSLFVADSEVSALRKVPVDGEAGVKTLVGRGLMIFGDVDGPGRVEDPDKGNPEARLQHALGVAYHDGKLYVADTYNSKIKVFDLKSQKLSTYLGGQPWGWLSPSLFSEPGGISYAAGKLYIADTNNHRIRVVDLATQSVKTLALSGVSPPTPVEVREKLEPSPKK